jgi:nucleotide-binding universal stress UspA family protein
MGEKKCALVKHQNILVATDGSPHSAAALDQAIGFADSCNSTLYIIHAIDTNPEFLAISPALQEKLENEGAQILAQAKSKATGAGVRCETIFDKSQQPYKAIVKTAKAKNIDLIVLGSHGKNALTKLVMGSVTRQVIGHTPCAVLVVPI